MIEPQTSFACHCFALAAARIAMGALILLMLCQASFADTSPLNTRDILRQAALYQIQFRRGDMDHVNAFVALLEDSTAAEPGNADLWYTLGVAHFNAAAAIALNGGNLADATPAYQRGTAALEQALKLDPEHAEALAIRAGTRLMMAGFVRKPEVAAQLTQTAVEEMNRAVALDPESKRARLQRAFSGLTLPLELRNHESEAEDLDYLSAEAGRSRAGDYIRLMRGDLDFELGRFEQARTLYHRVARSSSPAAAVATTRLAALDTGAIPLADIKALRVAAGAQCVMCHGK